MGERYSILDVSDESSVLPNLSILMILRNHHSEYGKFYDIELAPFAIKNLILKVGVVYSLIHFHLLLDFDKITYIG